MPRRSGGLSRSRRLGRSPYDASRAGPKFRQFVNDLLSKEVQRTISKKFGVELVGGSQTITVRGRSALVDAQIPDDGEAGMITVLFYFDDPAELRCGRSMRLRSSTDSADAKAETPSNLGTMIAFRSSDRFRHSPDLYRSARRYLVINWSTSNRSSRACSSAALSAPIQSGASLLEPAARTAADACV